MCFTTWQGNAIDQDHFITVSLPHQILVGFEGSFFKGETFMLQNDSPSYDDTFRLHLQDNWDNIFCGLLIRVVSEEAPMFMDIKSASMSPIKNMIMFFF